MTDELKEMLKNKQFKALKEALDVMEPIDIAQALMELNEKDMAVVFRLLSKELGAETFVELDSDAQKQLVLGFSEKELKSIFDELFVDDTVDIIEEMPANVVRRILNHADPDTRRDINELLKYSEDSAGSIMTTEYVNLRANMTVYEAFNRIRKTGVDKETIYTCYVTDDKKKLLGYLSIRTLLLSDKDDIIENIMDSNCIYVHTYDDKEEVAKMFSKYDFIAIPVVDKEQKLVGIITFDDAMDVMEDAVTEDMQLMGGVSPIDDSYLKTPAYKHWSKRIIWLIVLMISGTLTGLIISRYENLFAALPLLVSFIPRLMDTGGNCGSQSSTMIIRGLALGEVKPKDILRIIGKEALIALMVGATLAIANIGLIWIVYGSSENAKTIWYLCIAFGLTLMLVVMVAKLLGCTLPILAKKCRLDPALMASPIITTLVDVCAVTVYFAVVNWIVIPIM